jgi:hypothetical protein
MPRARPAPTSPRALYRAFLDRVGVCDPSVTEPPAPLDPDATPDLLGAVFVRQLHQKSHSAYYTPPRISQYLARTVVHDLIPQSVNALDADECEHLLTTALPKLRILDPACGAGDLLVATFHALFEMYREVLARSQAFDSSALTKLARDLTPSVVAAEIVSRNLFGVDLMPEAIEVAELRLKLAVAESLSPGSTLPELKTNLRHGNALIGLLDSAADPDAALLRQFRALGIAVERASGERPVSKEDLDALHPLHWAAAFGSAGFDAVIANPPWDIFKPNAREFFERHSDLVTKRKMSMEEFDATREGLLEDDEIREAWEEYVSSYRHVSAWFRSAPQFQHQASLVNGRRVGTDTNLYKLFTEQAFNLLRPGGVAGLVLPSGIYTDLGAKRLRELLFDQTKLTRLIGFENRRPLFEDVHRSFKFVLLTFRKEPRTESFPAVFMQHSLDVLDRFPGGAVELRTDLVRSLAPDSLSLMELKSPRDVEIAAKMIRHPLLGNRVKLSSEFHMTSDRKLFKTHPGEGRLPLFEGKMIWQFRDDFAVARYWVDEEEGRRALLPKVAALTDRLAYQSPRLGIRAIAANTNERTLIATLLPPNVFCGNSLLVASVQRDEALYLLALLNSFVVDAFLRSKVTTNVNIFYLRQLPIPLFDPEADWCRTLVQLSEALLNGTPDEDLKRARMEALVARLYGLDLNDFEHILKAFPLVDPTVRNRARKAFDEGLTT